MLTPSEVREFDRIAIQRLGIPGVVLMENAGLGCVDALERLFVSHEQRRSAVVLCGPGNNGGDGFVIARHLWNRGWSVRVLLCCDYSRYQGDAEVMLQPILRMPVQVVEVQPDISDDLLIGLLTGTEESPVSWIVDAMLGTGAKGAPRGIIRRAVEAANQTSCRRFAVDIPSGLDPESGEASSATFLAHATCTFVDHKSGFDNLEAKAYLGDLSVAPIGIHRRAIDLDRSML